MFSLKGKTAIVTGGGSGIGRAICQVFAKQGADVAILDLSRESGLTVLQEILETGGKAEFHKCDIGSQEESIACIDKIHAGKKRIDIMVNNAGISSVGNIENTSEEEMDRVFRVNVKGVYNGCKAVIPHMKADGGGSIINMASVASHMAIPDRFAYGMSKGAVLQMTFSVARDYVKEGVRCNCVAPARVHTPFVDDYLAKNYPGEESKMFDALSATQPIGRMGTPEEIANMVLYLASDESAFITGSSMPIDGGFLNLNAP